MIRSVVLAILALAGLLGATSFITSPQDAQPKFRPDAFLFKGRLVGVHYAARHEDGDGKVYVVLQFTIDEPYALLGKPAGSGGSKNVLTAWQADLENVNEDNFVAAIEGMFEAPIRLGQMCLVRANWPGAHGLELLDIEPANEASENAFLNQHHDYLVKYRRHENESLARVRLVKVRTVKNNLRTQRAMLDNEIAHGADPASFDALREYIRQIESGFEFQCSDARKVIEQQRESLRAELEGETREAERANLELMINDIDAVLTDLAELCEVASN